MRFAYTRITRDRLKRFERCALWYRGAVSRTGDGVPGRQHACSNNFLGILEACCHLVFGFASQLDYVIGCRGMNPHQKRLTNRSGAKNED